MIFTSKRRRHVPSIRSISYTYERVGGEVQSDLSICPFFISYKALQNGKHLRDLQAHPTVLKESR